MSGTNLTKTQAKWQALLAGVQEVIAAKASVTIAGKATTQAQIVAALQAPLALFPAAAQAKSGATVAVAALHAVMAPTEAFVKQLIATLKSLYGDTNPVLTKFGIALPKARTHASVGKKAVANVRRTNTRQARGPIGKNQRAAVQPNAVPTEAVFGPDGKPVAVSPAPVVAAPASSPGAAPTLVAIPGGSSGTGSSQS